MRFRVAFMALVVSLLPCLCLGQVTVPASVPLGKPIVASITLPSGSRVLWQVDGTASVINVGLGRAHIWADRGNYTLSAIVAPATGDMAIHTATFSVADSPPPPTVKTLAELAGAQAQAVRALYADLLVATNAGRFDSLALFRAVEKLRLDELKLTGHGATSAIAERLARVTELDQLANVLSLIVDDFGPAPLPVPPEPEPDPEPTPPEPGKRHVVIVRETGDNTPELGRVITGLRAQANDTWLKERGHVVEALDVDQLPSELRSRLGDIPPLPALYIFDAATGAMMYSDQLHAENAGAVIELIKRRGG